MPSGVRALAFVLALPALAASAASPAPAQPATAPTPAPSDDPCGGATRLLATLNRPTVGYSTCVVPPGAIVLEEGYQIATTGGASPSVFVQYPQGIERFGLTKAVEAVVVGPAFNRMRSNDGTISGFGDSGLGVKYQFASKTKVQYAFDALLTAATGSQAYTGGVFSETFNADIAYPLSPAVGIATTLSGIATGGIAGAATATRAASYARYGAFVPSLVVTVQPVGGTQFYAELVGQTRTSATPGGRTFVDFGVQKVLGPYLELDAEYGIVFAPLATRANYIGLGTGIRLK